MMTDGKHNNEPVYCPVNCWTEKDCPYAKDGLCRCENPIEECEDFKFFFFSWEQWERA